MNHKIYEEWLIANLDGELESLSDEQTRSLKEHIAGCPRCQSLIESLQQVHNLFSHAGYVAPQEGFVMRWRQTLENEKARKARFQSLILIGVFLSASATMIGFFMSQLVGMFQSPRVVLWSLVARAADLLQIISSFQEALIVLSRNFIGAFPFWGWILLVGLAIEIGVIWLVSYRVLMSAGRVKA